MKNVLISKVTTVFWRAKLHKSVRECGYIFVRETIRPLNTRKHQTAFNSIWYFQRSWTKTNRTGSPNLLLISQPARTLLSNARFVLRKALRLPGWRITSHSLIVWWIAAASLISTATTSCTCSTVGKTTVACTPHGSRMRKAMRTALRSWSSMSVSFLFL